MVNSIHYISGLLLGLFLAINVNANGNERWQQYGYITDSFVNIALRREYNNNAKFDMVRKWRKPVRVYVQSDVGNKTLQKELVAVQAEHLAAITQHSVALTNDEEKANVRVVFTQHNQLKNSMKKLSLWTNNSQKVLNEAACLANIKTSTRGEIIQAVVHIPVDTTRSSGIFLNCIVEELSQAMGLLNDSSLVFPSVFNDQSVDGYLSGLDYILLKILYHKDMRQGLKEERVRELVPEILAELDQQQEVQLAATKVIPLSIRQWFDG